MLNHTYHSLRYNYLRALRHAKASHTPLAPLYDLPFPPAGQSVMNTQFLAVDCEMNGLNPRSDALLSIGWVGIINGKIQNNSIGHIIINSAQSAGKSALIHGLDNYTLEDGGDASDALGLLAEKVRNSILVFHHAPIDLAFLQAAAMRAFGCGLLLPYVDTMALEKAKLARQDKHGGLQLQHCRDRYGLGAYAQHNALNDALATAELFLAQIHHRGKLDTITLSDLCVKCSA